MTLRNASCCSSRAFTGSSVITTWRKFSCATRQSDGSRPASRIATWSSSQSRAMSCGGQVGRGIQPSALTVRALTEATNFGTSGDLGSASCDPPPIHSSGRCDVRGSMNTSSTS